MTITQSLVVERTISWLGRLIGATLALIALVFVLSAVPDAESDEAPASPSPVTSQT